MTTHGIIYGRVGWMYYVDGKPPLFTHPPYPADVNGEGRRFVIWGQMKNSEQDYKSYIQSHEWRERAYQAKERTNYRCQLCNEKGDNSSLHAHHRTYKRLGNELPEDITVLCSDCHAKFHDKLPSIPPTKPTKKLTIYKKILVTQSRTIVVRVYSYGSKTSQFILAKDAEKILRSYSGVDDYVIVCGRNILRQGSNLINISKEMISRLSHLDIDVTVYDGGKTIELEKDNYIFSGAI